MTGNAEAEALHAPEPPENEPGDDDFFEDLEIVET